MLHPRLACTLLTGAALFAGAVAWSQDPSDNGRGDPDRRAGRRGNRFQRSGRVGGDRPQRGGFGRGGPSFERIAERFDENNDGKITKDEFTGPEEMFARMDRNADGVINADDFRGGFDRPGGGFGRGGGGFGGRGGGFGRGGGAGRMFGLLDSNNDGKITLDDLQAFFRKADTDNDDTLTVEELEKAIGGGDRGGRGGRFGRGFGGFQNFPTARPATGETAPAFELKDIGGKTVALADLLKTRPVVIEFGSFT